MTTEHAAHTPGPYTIQQLETERHGYDWPTFAIRSPQNVCLATVGDVDRYESERIPANARLFAAAPALLAALEAALPLLRLATYWTDKAGDYEARQRYADTAELARAALAQAKTE